MNKQFVILYFNIFLVFLGIGLIVPVLPVYLKDLGLNGSDLGVLVAAFALAQMVNYKYLIPYSLYNCRKHNIRTFYNI